MSYREQAYNYVRSADGREIWTPRSSRSSYGAPKTEMIARNDWPCKFEGCADRTVVANETVIVKIDGKWGHKACPKRIEQAARSAEIADDNAAEIAAALAETAEAREQEIALTHDSDVEIADALLNDYEARLRSTLEETRREHGAGGTMGFEEYREVVNEQVKRRINRVAAPGNDSHIADLADALLAEYEATRRAAAVETLVTRKLVYRVHLTDGARYGSDVVNVEIVPNAKYNNAKIGEFRGQGVGRIDRDGKIRFWQDVDSNDQRVRAVVAAVEILLGTADPIELARAYAIEAHECMRCGDTLVDDGNPYYPYLGPVCGKKFNKGE